MDSFLDFELPPHLIAANPSPARGEDRMMLLRGGEIRHHSFKEILNYIQEGDLLVFNNSRVLKARLFFSTRSGRKSELLLVERRGPALWTALIKKARKLKTGEFLSIGHLRAQMGDFVEDGMRELTFDKPFGPEDAESIGAVPLPPYILGERKRRNLPLLTSEDAERYQTVFAKYYGSVAAPTASLRFTKEIIESLEARGVRTAEVTLHVGLGTFKPMDCPPEEFKIHSEEAEISPETAALIARTKAEGGRIIAAGTTACRALEAFGGQAHRGKAEIFIRPGYQFKVVDGLITNFHLPHSTLLLLVQALAGVEPIRRAYTEALAQEYKFFSYGDGMLII